MMMRKKSEVPADISRLSFEEKLKLLPQADKDYLKEYIDRALTANAGNPKNQKIAGQQPGGYPEKTTKDTPGKNHQ